MAQVNLTDMLKNRAQAKPPAPSASALVPKDHGSSFQDKVKASQAKLSRTGHRFFPQARKAPEAEAATSAAAAAKAAAAKPAIAAKAPATQKPEETAGHPQAGRPAPKEKISPKEKSGPDGQACEPGSRDARRAAADNAGRNPARPGNPGMRPSPARDGVQADAASMPSSPQGDAAPVTPEAEIAGPAPVPVAGAPETAEPDLDLEKLNAALEAAGLYFAPWQMQDPEFLRSLLTRIEKEIDTLYVPGFGNLEGAPQEGWTRFAPETAAVPAAEPMTLELGEAPVSPETPTESRPAHPAGSAGARGNSRDFAAFARADIPAVAAPSGEAGPGRRAAGADLPVLADLIRERLAVLEKEIAPAGGALRTATPSAPVFPGLNLPAEARGMRTESDAQAPGVDGDRLRVLQIPDALAGSVARGAAAQGAGPETAHLALHDDEGMMAEAPLPEKGKDHGDAEPALNSDQRDESGFAGNPRKEFDTFGGNGRGAGFGAENGERAAQTKDPIAGQFHPAPDRMRALETSLPHRAAPVFHGMDQAVLSQIAKKMSVLAHRGTEEIQLQLEPEHLGRVKVALEMRQDGMNARIGVENEEVRKIVEANLAGLRDTLESQGIKLAGLEVSVEHRHSSLFNPDGSSAESFFHRQGREGGEAGQGNAAAEEAAGPETDTGRRWGYNTMEYLA